MPGRSASRPPRYGQEVLGGYPQVTTVRLVEAGTHLSVEALLKPAKAAEYPQAAALLKKVSPGDLVLWDRGYYGYSLLKDALDQGKQVLVRVSSPVVFEKVRTLPDGSYLADIYLTSKDIRHRTKALRVRVLEYTLDDPDRPSHGERHRLVTTLLDADQFPAHGPIAGTLSGDAPPHRHRTPAAPGRTNQPARGQSQDVQFPKVSARALSRPPSAKIVRRISGDA